MLYCEKCMILCPDGKCPHKPKHQLREVAPSDPVYLTSKNSVWAGLMKNVLGDNGIEYLLRGQLGAGLIATVGEVLEVYDFYVRFSDLYRAEELVNALFSESEDDSDAIGADNN